MSTKKSISLPMPKPKPLASMVKGGEASLYHGSLREALEAIMNKK